MKSILLLFLFLCCCGTKQFKNGKYDDVERINLLSDSFSESDLQEISKQLTESLLQFDLGQDKPIVLITTLEDKTGDKIDGQSIMDHIRVRLSERFVFLDGEARGDILKETGSKEQQTKAQFLLNGRIDSVTQVVDRNKTVYYKVTLNLTDLQTAVIAWSDHAQLRKVYKKQ